MANVAIMGFGTVGSGAYEIMTKQASRLHEKCGEPLTIKRVLDLKDYPNNPINGLLTKNFDDILNDDELTIVIETMGGTSPAYDFTKSLLEKGKNVVTSNKEVVAAHGKELVQIASKNNVKYLFEASVCGAIPIIRPIQNCLVANNIHEIKGILNGTTNYILTRMLKTGVSFEDVLEQAQKQGYAEKDPTDDIEGFDTCRKIAILSWLAFGEAAKDISWENIPTTGITRITLKELQKAEVEGFSIKLIGHAKLKDGKVVCKVGPMRLPKDNPLANVDDVNNAVLVSGDNTGDVMFYGRGAGQLATGSPIVADVVSIIRPS